MADNSNSKPTGRSSCYLTIGGELHAIDGSSQIQLEIGGQINIFSGFGSGSSAGYSAALVYYDSAVAAFERWHGGWVEATVLHKGHGALSA